MWSWWSKLEAFGLGGSWQLTGHTNFVHVCVPTKEHMDLNLCIYMCYVISELCICVDPMDLNLWICLCDLCGSYDWMMLFECLHMCYVNVLYMCYLNVTSQNSVICDLWKFWRFMYLWKFCVIYALCSVISENSCMPWSKDAITFFFPMHHELPGHELPGHGN